MTAALHCLLGAMALHPWDATHRAAWEQGSFGDSLVGPTCGVDITAALHWPLCGPLYLVLPEYMSTTAEGENRCQGHADSSRKLSPLSGGDP